MCGACQRETLISSQVSEGNNQRENGNTRSDHMAAVIPAKFNQNAKPFLSKTVMMEMSQKGYLIIRLADKQYWYEMRLYSDHRFSVWIRKNMVIYYSSKMYLLCNKCFWNLRRFDMLRQALITYWCHQYVIKASNYWKSPLVSMVYKKIFQWFEAPEGQSI